MPEATYIPLDGSNSRSCGWWSSLTGLEKVLIFLSATLAIFVFALTIALVSCKGETPLEPTTTTPATTVTTTTPTTVTPTNTTTTTKPTSPSIPTSKDTTVSTSTTAIPPTTA